MHDDAGSPQPGSPQLREDNLLALGPGVERLRRILLGMRLGVDGAQRLRVHPTGADIDHARGGAAEQRYLTHEQVESLAAACRQYRLVVLFLAYTGVRWGELAALRVGRLDLLRRRATIAESVTEVNGELVWGTPKTHERRAVPIPRFLVDELAEHVAGKGRDDLAFAGMKGGALRVRVFRHGGFDAAAQGVGVAGMHPHELRHTAASLAIAAGADVKVVQQMLGHKSATMTLDLYGHLFPDRLDEVADALDAAVRAVGLASLTPKMAGVADLEARRRALADE